MGSGRRGRRASDERNPPNHKAANPAFGIEQVHFFPLGGIKTNAEWAIDNGGEAARPANG